MRRSRRKVTTPDGRKLLSRVRAEELLGRPLKRDEVVHHKDEDPFNDDYDNLKVVDSQGAHVNLHRDKMARANKARSPAPNFARCYNCGEKIKLTKYQRSSWKRGRRHFYCDQDCYYGRG
jgi:hypothetical protein